MERINIADIKLLSELVEGNHTNQISTMTLRDFKIGQSATNIKLRLGILESYGYVKRGFPKRKAITYYITEEGIEFYKNAIK